MEEEDDDDDDKDGESEAEIRASFSPSLILRGLRLILSFSLRYVSSSP